MKTSFRIHLIVLTLIIAVLSRRPNAADLVVLDNGREYSGRLIEADGELLRLRMGDEVREFERDLIMSVHFQQEREWDAYQKVDDIDDGLLKNVLDVELDEKKYRAGGAGTLALHHGTSVELRTSQTWAWGERRIIKILNEHGESATIQYLSFLQGYERARIRHGVSIDADGRVAHLRDTAVKLESVYSEDSRYDDFKQYRFALPAGKPGTVLDVATVRERVEPRRFEHFYHEFLLGGTEPMNERRVEIIAPAGVDLRWQVLNDPDSEVEFGRKELDDGRVRHVWIRKDAPLLLPEPNMPPLSDVVPRLVVSAWPKDYDWQEVVQVQAQALDALADDCLKRLPNVDVGDDAEAIWYALADLVAVKPVAVNAGGWVPNAPSETWKLRSGSQLDRAFLLFCELRKKGVDVDFGWYRSRSRGELAADVVGLQAFDSPLLIVPKLGAVVPGDDLDNILDPLQSLGGCKTLIAQKGIAELPAPELASIATGHDVNVLVSDNGDAEVRESIVYNGAAGCGLRAWRLEKRSDLENRVRSLVRSRFLQAEDISWEFIADVTDDRQRRQGLRLRYKVPGLIDCRDTLAVAKLPWLRFDSSSVSREHRRYSMVWREPRVEHTTVEIDVPANWRLLNDAEQLQMENAKFAIAAGLASESAKNGCRRWRIEFKRNALRILPSEYPDYRKLVEKIGEKGNQYWLWSIAGSQ